MSNRMPPLTIRYKLTPEEKAGIKTNIASDPDAIDALRREGKRILTGEERRKHRFGFNRGRKPPPIPDRLKPRFGPRNEDV